MNKSQSYDSNIVLAYANEAEKFKRRVSDLSNSSFVLPSGESVDLNNELDLRQDYQNAVECLMQCESIISNFEVDLAVKDADLASKDERIASLEDRIVQMSLELASTKATEDQLRHKLRTSTTSVASVDEGSVSSQAFVAAFNQAKYRPVPNRRNKSSSSARSEDPVVTNDTDCAKTKSSFTTASTSANTSFTSASAKTSFTSTNSSCRQGWATLDESGTSRFSNIGQFFRRQPSIASQEGEAQQHEQFPKQDSTPCLDNQKQQPPAQQPPAQQPPARRRPNRKRHEMQKSSRSFLESRGVVFPVSSFEVLDKGCMDRDISKCSINELWPIINNKGSTNEEWTKKGCLNRDISKSSINELWPIITHKGSTNGSTNEEWPEFGSR